MFQCIQPPRMAEESVAAVQFRAPPFYTQDPTLWFSVLECHFQASGITSSLTKFAKATALLPPDILAQVPEVINAASSATAPSTTIYHDLKTAVLKRLQSTVATRLQELLSKEELGNEKPSDLLRRMKNLLADKYTSFDKELFLQLFYQRLPAAIQRSLFTVKSTLDIDALATLTDEFMATLAPEPSAVTSVATQVSTMQLADLVAKLSLQVQDLQGQLNDRSRSRSPYHPHRSRRRTRSRSNTKDSSGVCFYHRRFGMDARRCNTPCAFTTLNPTSEH